MATNFNCSIALAINILMDNGANLGKDTGSLNIAPSVVFTNGNGANKATSYFKDTRTIAASSSENLDLAAVLLNPFGAAITFTKVKAIYIKAAAGNTNDVLVGGAASAGFVSPVGDATDVIRVRPGGIFLLTAPDANGLSVTATTADILKIANSTSGSSVTYDVVIVGEAT